MHREESRRDQVQTSSYPLPMESYRAYLFLPATMYDNTYEVLPTKETHPSLAIQDFYWEVSHADMKLSYDWPVSSFPRDQTDTSWLRAPGRQN